MIKKAFSGTEIDKPIARKKIQSYFVYTISKSSFFESVSRMKAFNFNA